MKTLTELLQEWSELENNRCRLDEEDKEWCVMTSVCWSCLPDPDMAPSDVQGAVQNAIEARSWDYEQVSGIHDGQFVHEVTINPTHVCYTEAHSTNSAIAYLEAYLIALKSLHETAEAAG